MTQELTLNREKHIEYIKSLNSLKDYQFWLSEHLRMNGIYWGLNCLDLLNSTESFNKEEVVQYVLSCFNGDGYGGFGSFPKHDSHLLSTLSALQILLIYDSLDVLTDEQVSKITNFIKSNRLPNGSFQGDRFGEIDTRFVYTAIQSLAILSKLDEEIVEGAVSFIQKCANFDGGYGLIPGAESHSAQVFTCLATLAIVNRLDVVDVDLTGWWLSERQVENGGLNGRPSKLPDVCYSWWVLSSLAIIGKLEWINFDKLSHFILEAQDNVTGGISDRPENQVDVFHTLFGICGLSLMGYKDLKLVDPIYCLSTEVSAKIKKWPYN